jgi:hypothetical protein|tara:strand:+ start:1577 stop:3562 length:1986 start_codon:yes stop_codon:yes gene_type:complete
MSFIQENILFGLPLILLPVIIHLINRMRHKPRKWAAMQFLFAATQSSTSHSKIKNWLILAMRILAVLMLLLFLSRPLVGGWMGWAFGGAPDIIMLLVDRSASMESRISGTNKSRREYAIEMIVNAAEKFENKSQIVLIDSATRKPQNIANAASILELPDTQPSDTAADIPAMLQSALDWLVDNQAGIAEIWIASDLQATNWLPDDSRWESLMESFNSLKQKVRIRMLATTQDSPMNASISVSQLARIKSNEIGEVRLAVDIKRTKINNDTEPIKQTINGVTTEIEAKVNGQATRWRHRIEVDEQSGGWGKLELSPDGNPQDNITYYRYDDDFSMEGLVISESKLSPLWQAAASTVNISARKPAKILAPNEFSKSDLRDSTLVIWHAPLPQGDTSIALREFINEGGRLVFFPTGEATTVRFVGLGWGEKQTTEKDPFKIGRWDEDQGPLANTDEGLLLPLNQLTVKQRQKIVGEAAILAAFNDGQAFLARQTIGQGEVYFCSSLPLLTWSNLGDGMVIVPMIQRLLAAGSSRFQRNFIIETGRASAGDMQLEWTSAETGQRGNLQTEAGVYRSGDRWLVVNRPENENEFKRVEDEKVSALFSGLTFRLFQAQRDNTSLQSEIWDKFLILMLIALLIEAWLICPKGSFESDKKTSGTLPNTVS